MIEEIPVIDPETRSVGGIEFFFNPWGNFWHNIPELGQIPVQVIVRQQPKSFVVFLPNTGQNFRGDSGRLDLEHACDIALTLIHTAHR